MYNEGKNGNVGAAIAFKKFNGWVEPKQQIELSGSKENPLKLYMEMDNEELNAKIAGLVNAISPKQ